jgi:hypothetical protein
VGGWEGGREGGRESDMCVMGVRDAYMHVGTDMSTSVNFAKANIWADQAKIQFFCAWMPWLPAHTRN